MARTLANLEKDIQFHARDGRATFAAGSNNLRMLNLIYRRLAISVEWPEFLVEDTSLVTVIDQAQYSWPANAPDAVKTVEVTSDVGSGSVFGAAVFGVDKFGPANVRPRLLTEPPTELDWTLARQRGSTDTPLFYRRITVSGTHKLEIQPPPSVAGRTIIIRGLTEPTELSAPTDQTVFDDSIGDDILALSVAAEYSTREGDATRGQELEKRVVEYITAYFQGRNAS